MSAFRSEKGKKNQTTFHEDQTEKFEESEEDEDGDKEDIELQDDSESN